MKPKSDIGQFVDELMQAGCMPKVAAQVVTALYGMAFSEGASSAPKDQAAEKRRAWDRERKRRVRRKPVESGGSPVERDAVNKVWTDGAGLLVQLGAAQRYAKSNIGLWLKRGHDPTRILQIIGQAHEQRIGEPVAWVTAALNAEGKPNGKHKSPLTTALDDLVTRATESERPGEAVFWDNERDPRR